MNQMCYIVEIKQNVDTDSGINATVSAIDLSGICKRLGEGMPR